MLASSAQKNTGPTPGPWRVEDVGFPPGNLAIMAGSSTEYRWLATVSEDLKAGIDWTQTQANARLVAAAPDLLASCIELRDVLNHDCGASEYEHLFEHIGPATIRASAAITKAGVVEP